MNKTMATIQITEQVSVQGEIVGRHEDGRVTVALSANTHVTGYMVESLRNR